MNLQKGAESIIFCALMLILSNEWGMIFYAYNSIRPTVMVS